MNYFKNKIPPITKKQKKRHIQKIIKKYNLDWPFLESVEIDERLLEKPPLNPLLKAATKLLTTADKRKIKKELKQQLKTPNLNKEEKETILLFTKSLTTKKCLKKKVS